MVDLKSQRTGYILIFLVGLVAITVLNQLAERFPIRLDLTEEKRHSISPATEFLVKNLDDIVYIDIYLDGELPAGFKRLQTAIHETLDEFQVHAAGNIQYNFVNPDQATSQQARNEFMQYLANRGIQPTNVFANEGGKRDPTPYISWSYCVLLWCGKRRTTLEGK